MFITTSDAPVCERAPHSATPVVLFMALTCLLSSSGLVIPTQRLSCTLEPHRCAHRALQETRGRWNSTDNVMQLGWSGSAVLGGFLLDRYSFDGTFLITASVQARCCQTPSKS